MKYLYRNSTKLKICKNTKRFETIIELDDWASKIWGDWELQYINDFIWFFIFSSHDFSKVLFK